MEVVVKMTMKGQLGGTLPVEQCERPVGLYRQQRQMKEDEDVFYRMSLVVVDGSG